MEQKNIKQIGIVFNLDKHDEDGSHWVSMFINLDKNYMYYFDSFGTKEPPEVLKLVKRLKKEYKNHNKEINYKRNTIRHQFNNSECGVYCINFIVNMLKGKDFDSFIKNIKKDEQMNNNRDLYFIS